MVRPYENIHTLFSYAVRIQQAVTRIELSNLDITLTIHVAVCHELPNVFSKLSIFKIPMKGGTKSNSIKEFK